MRSSFPITIPATLMLMLMTAATAATQSSHHHPTATVVPNGTSCPSSNTQAIIPPLGKGAIAPDTAHDNAPTIVPDIAGHTPCPATGSDAETNIARGNALAKPEPLNSPTLITPRH